MLRDYLINCESLIIVAIDEQTHSTIGTVHIADLLDIFDKKAVSRYYPIVSSTGFCIGDLHVSIKLLDMVKTAKSSPLRSGFHEKLKAESDKINEFPISSPVKYSAVPETIRSKSTYLNSVLLEDQEEAAQFAGPKMKNHSPMKFYDEIQENKIYQNRDDIYRSVLRSKFNYEADDYKKDLKRNIDNTVTDKLVTKIVTRAQRLRNAIIKETNNDDSEALSDNSSLDSLCSSNAAPKEARLYKYLMGKKMSLADEHKAIETLLTTSPSPSLVDFATATYKQTEQSETNGLNSCSHKVQPINNAVPRENSISPEIKGMPSIIIYTLELLPCCNIFYRFFRNAAIRSR